MWALDIGILYIYKIFNLVPLNTGNIFPIFRMSVKITSECWHKKTQATYWYEEPTASILNVENTPLISWHQKRKK